MILRAIADSRKGIFSDPVTKMCWISKRWDPFIPSSKRILLNKERKMFESHMILLSYRLLVVFMIGQISVNMCKHHISHLSKSAYMSASLLIWLQDAYQMAFEQLPSSTLQWPDINTIICKLHDDQKHILVKPLS